jgi:hypothetical protein
MMVQFINSFANQGEFSRDEGCRVGEKRDRLWDGWSRVQFGFRPFLQLAIFGGPSFRVLGSRAPNSKHIVLTLLIDTTDGWRWTTRRFFRTIIRTVGFVICSLF